MQDDLNGWLRGFARQLLAVLLGIAMGVTAHGCHHEDNGDHLDADADERGQDAEQRDVSLDSGDEDGADPSAGALTFVVQELEIVRDRLCDLDGDGAEDNSVDDLGTPGGDIFAGFLSTAIQGFISEGSTRLLFHIPCVEDPLRMSDDDVLFIGFEGREQDLPMNWEDDFSGEEPFIASQASVDECGEPLHVLETASLDYGALTATGGTVPLPAVPPGRFASLTGSLDAGGESAEVRLCAVLRIDDLGGGGGFPTMGDLSTLEVLLAGGAAAGVPAVPGLNPDVDLDGDGLESFEVDEDNHIVACLDGDWSSVGVEGGGCWQDPRMADGFSVNMRLRAVSARFVGPGGGARLSGFASCAEVSQWRECGAESCHLGEARSCDGGCQWCLPYQASWGPCQPNLDLDLTDCDELVLHGGATCDGVPPAVELVDGPSQVRGLIHQRELIVGNGPVSIEARVESRLSGSALPACGWAIAAYIDSFGSEIFGAGFDVGVDQRQVGYSLEWHYYVHSWVDTPEDQQDVVIPRVLIGYDSSMRYSNAFCTQGHCPSGEPPLDSDTVGSVEQALALVVEPDLPLTSDNEMRISSFLLTDRGREPLGTVCEGQGCPVQLRPGDGLSVGVTAGTADGDAIVEVLSFEATTEGECP